MSIRNLIPILDLDNKIEWENKAFFGICTRCQEKVYKGIKIWNNRLNRYKLYCNDCTKLMGENKEEIV